MNMYRVANVPGQGMATIASQIIDRGSLIISDEPLLTFVVSPDDMVDENHFLQLNHPSNGARSIAAIVARMSRPKRNVFNRLFDPNPAEAPLSIVRANAFTAVETGPNGGSISVTRVYQNVSRVNHSCQPNAAYHWNETIKRGTVYAIQQIEYDEQITIDYRPQEADFFRPAGQRQASLRLDYGFDCTCPACVRRGRLNVQNNGLRLRASNLHGDIDFVVQLGERILDVDDDNDRRFVPYETTRRNQIVLLNDYIAILEQLRVGDTKLANAYLARAEYFYQGFKRSQLGYRTFQADNANEMDAADLILAAKNDYGRASGQFTVCQGSNHPEAIEAWTWYGAVSILASHFDG